MRLINKPTIIFLIIFSMSYSMKAQSNWVNGFAGRTYGENLDYHSCHPEANLSLLIRCLNDKDYIEWVTDTIPPGYKNELVTFTWIAGYSTATSTAPHKFYLYVNEQMIFEINTDPNQERKDWKINSDNGAELHFKFISVDAVDDFFGYMVLTVPMELLNGLNYAKIKVKGDGSNSKVWYMTMQYPLTPKIRILPEKVVSKDSDGNLLQRVKISIDHFDSPKPVIITAERNNISSELNLGMNDFYLNFTAPKNPTKVDIKISVDGKTNSYSTIINPAREITFYLIPHAHVDIGYTELQTEVEKKHWENFERAIEYSKNSVRFGHDALFRWNVETLWAVKSYIENFPDKKEEFFNTVKSGWIGLDATYVNVMTALCRPEELYRLVDYSNELEEEIGIKIESAMISDIPGYTWGTVQAMADNGIKYFSVGTNEFDRIGNTLKTWGDKPFYWTSPSGKEKILIWLAGKGYSWFHKWRLTRDDFSPITKYLDELDEKNYPYNIVHLKYNIGGDNGFPDSTLSEFVKQWNENHVTPKFKIATNAEMFKDFEEKYGNTLPTYSGDFSPYWEDGAGSTAKETALNRNTAELLNQLEILYTLFNKDNFPKEDFDEAWRYVLLFSEHTWGAWNSISDPEIKFVTDQWDIKKSYAIIADSIAQKLLHNISGKSTKSVDHFYVFNSSSWERSDVIKIPGSLKAGNSIMNEEGNLIPTQELSDGDIVFTARNIPAFGFKSYKFSNAQKESNSETKFHNNLLSNNHYTISLNENYSSINSLKKTGTNFNIIDETNGFGINEFIHTGQNAENETLTNDSKVIKFEDGPVLKTIWIKSDAKGCNNLLQEITLYNDIDRIDIKNNIDKSKDYNKESIRFAFPLNIKDPVSRIDLAWSVIQPEVDQLKGSNKNYFTAQRWVDISNNDYGLTIAVPDAPFVEFGGMNAEAWMSSPDKEWALSTSSSSLCYSWALNNSWHTNFKASQEGEVEFKYSIRAHDQFDYLEAYKFGIESSQPLHVLFNDDIIKNYSPLIKLSPESPLVITTLKTSKDKKGVIVRIFNWKGTGNVNFYLSNGDEEEKEILDNKITLSPFQVVTLKINTIN